jgi:hypothetical protein
LPSVFVIEEGDYSDYRVVGVFSTREKAEIVLSQLAKREYGSEAEISEWPLNPGVAALSKGWLLWLVWMERDGTVEKCEQRELSAYDLGTDAVSLWRRSEAPAYRGRGVKDVLNASVFAKDSRHAVKIVNEIRAQWIAENKWSA